MTRLYTECMSITDETTIRVPVSLRDLIRSQAASHGLKQADLLSLALRELEQAEFLRSVAAVPWDETPDAEAQTWDDAELVSSLDPWQP